MKWYIIVLVALTTACSESNKTENTSSNTPSEPVENELDTTVVETDTSIIDDAQGDLAFKQPETDEIDGETSPPSAEVTSVPPPPIDIVVKETDEPEVLGGEVAAKFPGGSSKLAAYYRTNFIYPQRAKDIGLEGKVYVKFTVNTDGSLSNIHVRKKFDALLDDAAIEFIKNMPKWVPATSNKKKVKDEITLPVDFRL